MWIEMYSPKRFRDLKFIGNQHLAVLKYLKNYKITDKPLLIIGPSGIGKSILIEIIAKMLNYNLIYESRDDFKTYSEYTFNKKRNLIVIDYIPKRKIKGLHVILLNEYIKPKENYEIIFLNKECDYNFFNEILKKQNIIFNKTLLENILSEMNGDYRSALNFLQLVSPSLKKNLTLKFEKFRNISPFQHLKNIENRMYKSKKEYLSILSDIHSPLLLSVAYNNFNSFSIENFYRFSEILSFTDDKSEVKFLVYDSFHSTNIKTEYKFQPVKYNFLKNEILPFFNYFPQKFSNHMSEEIYEYYKNVNNFYKNSELEINFDLPIISKRIIRKDFYYRYKPGSSSAVKKLVKMKDLK